MKPQVEPSTQEVLAGLVERVTFHNDDNGFCVIRIKARGHRDLVTVVGHAATISAGEWITASGEWINDHTHGQQFKSRFMRTSAPTSIDGIEKYLGSGMIRGIGPVYAKKLVKAFGEKVFDTIEAEPDRLREVTGIGPVRAKRITDGWAVAGDLLVVAAGAWLPALMPDRYGGSLVYRQGLCYVEPPARFKESWRNAPAIAVIGDRTGYTLPDRRGAGLKIGYTAHRRLGAPDQEGFGSDLTSESAAILGAFRPYFNDPDAYVPIRIQVGFYVRDETHRFTVDRIGRTVVVTNCDGQMFKFGALIGERLIGMFEGRESAADLARWAAGY